MLRTTTAILVTISVVFMVTASGCSESDDTIVVPRDRDGWTPCPDYIPGLVYAYFDSDTPLDDIDIVVRSFGLMYTYIARGEVWVHTHVVEGDALDVLKRVSESPLVDRVNLYRDYMRIRFVVGVTLDDALAFVASYPEMVIAGTLRDWVYVEFEVTVGDEDEWVNRFLEEDLVIYSTRVAIACPVE